MSGVGRLERARRASLSEGVAGSVTALRVWLALLLVGGAAASLPACGSGGGSKLGERVIPFGQPVPKGGGVYRVGQPYQIGSVWYYPREDPGYERVGRASWYGELFHGRRTANGEIYDMDRLSAAHPTLPMPVYARVTNLENGRSVVVRVNDRGPYANDRIIDVSRRSAEVLGFRRRGTAVVRVSYLGRAPLNGDDSYERRYLAAQDWTPFAVNSSSQSNSQSKSAVAGRSTSPAAPGQITASSTKHIVATKVSGVGSNGGAVAPASNPRADPQPTGSLGRTGGGLLIQAGSFKSKENAERARSSLGRIGPVEVTEIEVGGDVYFRVRVGPFADRAQAEAALGGVTQAGFLGARLLSRN